MDEKELVELIISESKDIERILNIDFMGKYCELHNVDLEHNKLRVKQEVVAKRGYFMSVKKKYALKIVNQEGKWVDECDIKGISSKRSDYPQFTKIKISKLLDLILLEDNISFKKIREFVSDTENEAKLLCISGDKSVARPVSFSRKVNEYKKVPSHVLGMLLWNDLEYNYFVKGTKGYLYKISGVDLYIAPNGVKRNIHKMNEKHNNIVLPYEEDKLPEHYSINVDAMLDFCWVQRYRELLSPIMNLVDKGRKVATKSIVTF